MLQAAAPVFEEFHFRTSILSTGNEVGAFADELASVGYEVHHLPYSKIWRYPTLKYLRQLYALIRRGEYDVVHIHPERSYLAHALVARFAGVKRVIRTVHHIYPQPRTWVGTLRRCEVTLERFFCRFFLNVIFVSNSKSGLLNEKQTYFSQNELIYNWFNSELFQYGYREDRARVLAELNIPSDALVLVSLGKNWDYKNYSLVIEALSLLQDENIFYLQVGPEGEGAPLTNLACKLGLQNQVLCMGRVEDPLPYLKAADFYIMPSTIEGFGCAAVEAMGIGLPCIFSYVPALKDFENLPGITYTQELTARSVADAILSAKEASEEERLNAGKDLSMHVQRAFSPENTVPKYVSLYKRE